MQRMIVEKPARLNGEPVGPGEEVELDPALAAAWAKKGLARYAGAGGFPGQAKEEEPSEVELAKLSRRKLLVLAEERGIDVSDKPSKVELVRLLEEE